MTRYILSRHDNPISESFATLDEALEACFGNDGRYIIDVRRDGASGQYLVRTSGGSATIEFRK